MIDDSTIISFASGIHLSSLVWECIPLEKWLNYSHLNINARALAASACPSPCTSFTNNNLSRLTGGAAAVAQDSFIHRLFRPVRTTTIEGYLVEPSKEERRRRRRNVPEGPGAGHGLGTKPVPRPGGRHFRAVRILRRTAFASRMRLDALRPIATGLHFDLHNVGRISG